MNNILNYVFYVYITKEPNIIKTVKKANNIRRLPNSVLIPPPPSF